MTYDEARAEFGRRLRTGSWLDAVAWYEANAPRGYRPQVISDSAPDEYWPVQRQSVQWYGREAVIDEWYE